MERPERRRRINNTYRENVMTTNGDQNPNAFQPAPLPSLAPANLLSSAPQEAAMLTSSFRVHGGTPSGTAGPPHYSDGGYPQSSPMTGSIPYQSPHQPRHSSIPRHGGSRNGYGAPAPPALVKPERPEEPYRQFYAHMKPQLQDDNYDPDLIDDRIAQEWENLSSGNKQLWVDRYNGQMRNYEAAMDEFRRAERAERSQKAGLGR
jgi:hypothetical protein